MEKCYENPSKTFIEGLENFQGNEHQDVENMVRPVFQGLLSEQNGPSNREKCTDDSRKVIILENKQICGPTKTNFKLLDESKESTNFEEFHVDEHSSQCNMTGNVSNQTSEGDTHNERQKSERMKERNLTNDPSNNGSDRNLKMSAAAETTSFETVTSQTPFQSILNKGSEDSEIPSGTTSIASRAFGMFGTNESEKSVLCEQEISACDVSTESIIVEDTTEVFLTNIPGTPRVLIENSPNENYFSHSECCTSSITKNDLFCEDASLEKYPLDRPDTPKVHNRRSSNYLNPTFSLDERKMTSDFLRRSIDSQVSETPSSISSSIESTSISKSHSKKPDLDGDDSSSPLLVRKKRKRDVFKDTDCEEDAEDEDTLEKSFAYNKTQKYQHQTHASDNDEDGSCSAESRNVKFKSYSDSDFKLMMGKKREERQKGRKRGNGFITLNDELIDQLVDRMEEAAYEDRILNKKGQPAIKKVSLLKYAVSQLRKKDLQPIFLEHNILRTLTEWLSPLPSRCLPCLQIRENILRLLQDFPRIEARLIRFSGLGRALKFLRDHTDETKENKERCIALIEKWTRPIHDSSSDYRFMTKRERQQRDYELSLRYAKQKSKNSIEREKAKPKTLDITLQCPPKTEASRPGEPGWVPRARVPQLSVRDYINRPESKLECEIMTKLKPSRFEILLKKYQKTMRERVFQRSLAKLSIVGDKM